MAVVAPTPAVQIASLYVAIFNRAPDQAGLNAWVAQLAAGKSFASIAAGFTSHEVFTTGIGTLSNAAYVAALYTNVLGSAGDAAGTAAWVALLNGGASKSDVAAAFVQSALTVDIAALQASGALSAADAAAAQIRQDTLTNKANAGVYFANTLGTASNLSANTVTSSKAGLLADPAYNASVNAIANVTNTAASLTAAKDAINVAVGTGNPITALLGQTLTLTLNQDTLVGGLSNDTFVANALNNAGALINSLQNADNLNGGAGTDTLKATLVEAATVAPTLTNIENVNVSLANGAAILDLTNATGVTTVTVTGSTVAPGTNSVQGLGNIANVAVTNQVVGAVLAGSTATTLGLTLDTIGKAPLTVGGTPVTVTAVDLAAAGASSTATTLNLTANNAFASVSAGATGTSVVKNLSVAASGVNSIDLTTGTASIASTVTSATITGAGSVTLVGTLAAATTLNASANLGGVTATVANTAITVTGGAGNDSITSTGILAATANYNLGAGNDTFTIGGAQAAAGAVVNGGDGTDTLVVTNSTYLNSFSKAAYIGFETLQVNSLGAAATTVTVDPTLLTGITAYKVGASTGAVALTNLAAAPTVTVAGNVAGTAGLALTLKDATGTADVATVTLDNGVTVASTTVLADGVSVSKLSAAGVETINLHSNGLLNSVTGGATAAANSVTNDATANTTLSKVVIDGSQAINFVTGASTKVLTVDASTATGKVGVDASAATAVTNINGGTAADTIKAGTAGGVIYGGAGGDSITLGAGADTIVYKSANDSKIALVAGVANAALIDSVTAFTTGTDKIDLTALGFTAATDKVVFSATAADVTAALALATAQNYTDSTGTARGVLAVTVGADTYAFVDANHDHKFDAATDLVIKVTGTVTTSDVVFG
jgi:hypothetical protein